MTCRKAALLIGIGVGTLFVEPAVAANLEFIRNSRPVTSEEASGGAPVGGTVHDFFVTSDADLLVLGPVLDVSIYKHPYNSNHEAPDPELVAMFPAVGASSFLRLPGDTIVLGGGFTSPGSAWGDFSNDGPQYQFLFGRLTTTQAGTFSGTFFIRGEQTPIEMPFSMSLPGPGEGLQASSSEQLSLFAEESKPEPIAQIPVQPSPDNSEVRLNPEISAPQWPGPLVNRSSLTGVSAFKTERLKIERAGFVSTTLLPYRLSTPRQVSASATIIPEPTGFALCLLGAKILTRRRST